MSESLPVWEDLFFAKITLDTAESRMKDVTRAHETVTLDYLAAVESKNGTDMAAARQNMRRSLNRVGSIRKNLVKAQERSSKLLVTTAQ